MKKNSALVTVAFISVLISVASVSIGGCSPAGAYVSSAAAETPPGLDLPATDTPIPTVLPTKTAVRTSTATPGRTATPRPPVTAVRSASGGYVGLSIPQEFALSERDCAFYSECDYTKEGYWEKNGMAEDFEVFFWGVQTTSKDLAGLKWGIHESVLEKGDIFIVKTASGFQFSCIISPEKSESKVKDTDITIEFYVIQALMARRFPLSGPQCVSLYLKRGSEELLVDTVLVDVRSITLIWDSTYQDFDGVCD